MRSFVDECRMFVRRPSSPSLSSFPLPPANTHTKTASPSVASPLPLPPHVFTSFKSLSVDSLDEQGSNQSSTPSSPAAMGFTSNGSSTSSLSSSTHSSPSSSTSQIPDTSSHTFPSNGAFVFPFHSTQAAQHHASGSSSTQPPPAPSSYAAGFDPRRRRSSASRKPSPALSASLEDISIQESIKSRSSTSSKRRSPSSTMSVLPVDPPSENITGLSPHSAAALTTSQDSARGRSSRQRSPRTSKEFSNPSVNNTGSQQFVPPSKPPPHQPHALPHSPSHPSPNLNSLFSPLSASQSPLSTSSSTPTSPLPEGTLSPLPAVRALARSRYVRAASPGTVPSPSPSRPATPTGLPLTPPSEPEKEKQSKGFFATLRGKKSSTSTRPGSASSSKSAFGGGPSSIKSQDFGSAIAPLSPSPSSSSFGRQKTRNSAHSSPAHEDDLDELEGDPWADQVIPSFDSYALTDLTPPTSIPFATLQPTTTSKSKPSKPSKSRPTTADSLASNRRPSVATQCSSTSGGVRNIAPTSWDLSSELNALERRDRRKKGLGEKDSLRIKGKEKEGKKEKKERLRREDERFDPDARPSAREMFEASLFEVIDGDGKSHMFGDLIKDQRTIVVFIRHWYCPLCSDFVYSIVQDVDPEALQRAGAKLIIIGNGSPKVVHVYKDKIFDCPFEVYTDPTLELYRALGMTRQTGDGGPEDEKGDYVKHGTLGGTLMVARNLGKMGRKGVTLSPGHFTQLGGEFVLGPGLAAHYTHRMHNTRGHASIKIALAHAGVVGSRRPRPPGANPHPQATASWTGGDSDLDRLGWKVARDGELERMRTWREERRRGRLFSPEGDTIRETIHEDSGSEDGMSTRRQSNVAEERRGSADAVSGPAPYSLRHHLSVVALEEEGVDFDQPRRPSTPELPAAILASPNEPLPSSATFGFPTPPTHVPYSPTTPEFASSPYTYGRSPRTRTETAESSPIVDLGDPLSMSLHLSSPQPSLDNTSRYRTSSAGTMGFPNEHSFFQQREREHSAGTLGSEARLRSSSNNSTDEVAPRVVEAPASESSSLSRKNSRDEEEAEEEGESEDSSYEFEDKVLDKGEVERRVQSEGIEEFGGFRVVAAAPPI